MDFDYDYRGMGEWLRGPECLALVQDRTDLAKAVYQSIVAKRSGNLAESASTSIEAGPNERPVGVLTVGGSGAPYGASHEFGTQFQDPTDDLNIVLAMLGTL